MDDHGLLQVVAEASERLRNAREYEAIVAAAAGAAVPGLADLAALRLTDDDVPRTEIVAVGPIQDERSWRDVAERIAPLLANRDGASGPWWLPSLGDAQIHQCFGDERAVPDLLRRLGTTSLLALPLATAGRSVGVLVLARVAGRQPFGAADLAAATILARRAALALHDGRVRELALRRSGGTSRLADELAKWAHLFEHASWGVAIVGADGNALEAANPAFARMHGYDGATDLHGIDLTELVAPESVPELVEYLARADTTPTTFESLHRRRDGTPFPALMHLASMRGADGRVLYRAVNVQDLSDVKRNEERLHHAQRMEAVGRLAGGVAHEVNNMMTIILGFTDLLAATPDLGDRPRGDIDEIRKAALRAAAITQQLLAFSRRQVHQPSVLDLNAVVAETAALLRPLLPSDVHVETRLTRLRGSVRADRAQLEQVLINLAFNARDAMPHGGRLTLSTEFRTLGEDFGIREVGTRIPPGRYGFVSVTDTGRGMDEATRARVFEPFFTTKGPGQGTGLGLSTVYGIVKQSGGYVWVESAPGWGSTFTVCLPEAEAEPAAEAGESTAGAATGGTERILLVEDEPGLRAVAARLLRAQGYEVIEAANGTGALQALGGTPGGVQLVITDLVMPDVGGKQLRAALRQAAPGVPVLFMSAYARRELLDRGQLDPDDPFVQKPFTLDALADRVRELLDATAHTAR